MQHTETPLSTFQGSVFRARRLWDLDSGVGLCRWELSQASNRDLLLLKKKQKKNMETKIPSLSALVRQPET